MSARAQLRLILDHADTELLALFIASTTLLWGLWLLLPAESFLISSSFDVYRRIGMSLHVHAETLFGCLYALNGAVHLFGVATGAYRARRWGAFGSMLLWLSMLLSAALSTGLASPGLPQYLCESVASWWLFWRMSGPRAAR